MNTFDSHDISTEATLSPGRAMLRAPGCLSTYSASVVPLPEAKATALQGLKTSVSTQPIGMMPILTNFVAIPKGQV